MYIISLFDKSWSYSKRSYSQESEDLFLENYFGEKTNGFYIDVGACHPFRFSNTYLFYKKGWRGINIDATPGSMNLFNKYRSRDLNIETAISNKNRKINYFIFDEPALNSFSRQLSKKREVISKYKIEKVIKLTPKKLSEILDKYLPLNTKIDFMSIDVEGHEYEVLVSNNWNKYKPEYLLVEMLKIQTSDTTKNRIYSFLKSKNYVLIDNAGRTEIFKKKI